MARIRKMDTERKAFINSLLEHYQPKDAQDIQEIEYYGAAEPPVRCGESHLSGLTEPPHFVY